MKQRCHGVSTSIHVKVAATSIVEERNQDQTHLISHFVSLGALLLG